MKRSREPQEDGDGSDEKRTLTARPRRNSILPDTTGDSAQPTTVESEASQISHEANTENETTILSDDKAEKGENAPTNEFIGIASQKLPQKPQEPLISTEATIPIFTSPNPTTTKISPLFQLPKPPPTKWGFVIYRTTYDNDTEWTTFKSKLWEAVEVQRGGIEKADFDVEGVTFDFVDDRPELDGVGVGRLRREYQYKDPGSLCQHVFLMADKASVDSVLHRTDEQQPYIIAVDDGNHTYEMSDDEDDSDSNSNTNPDSNSNPNSDNDNENTKIDGKSEEEKDQKEKDLNAPDGTLRIHIEWLLREFYLGEMRHDGAHLEDLVGYSKPGYVWSGMLW